MTTDTLSQTIAHKIRKAIQQGTYHCGERLVELSLSQELNVSQNTVRDALYQLEQEAWVEKIARHGVFVSDFTIAEAKEIHALWWTVEGLILEWGLPNLLPVDRTRLRELIVNAEIHVQMNQWLNAVAAIYQFHASLVDHVDAPQSRAILHRLHNQARLLETKRYHIAHLTDDEWEERLERYFDLIVMMDRNDIEGAKRQLKHVIQFSIDTILLRLE